MTNKIVAICAGHNSQKDSGAVAKDGTTEEELVVNVRNAVASYFHKHKDVHVRVDGYGKTNLSLTEAVKLIKGSDVAIEWHLNASENKTAGGTETISLQKDKHLSQKISKAISEVLGTKLRGDKGHISQEQSARGKLAFVSNGGIIIETCFISNSNELKAYEEKYWLVAKAVYHVLCEYLGITALS